MADIQKALQNICKKIKETHPRPPLTYAEFLEMAAKNPDLVLRNIFQMMYDMIYRYVGEGVDEYPEDPESIHYVCYDCSNLFVNGSDNPFFADRLFANRLINHVASFRRGMPQNRIYIFEGPHGCGKSTFLNNLLMKFEQYTKTPEGACYETIWRLDKKELGVIAEHEAHTLLMQLRQLAQDTPLGPPKQHKNPLFPLGNKSYLEIPCPSHDHPILIIPKPYRREVLDELIEDKDFKEKLFTEKQYEWVFRNNPCTICLSLYQALIDMLGSPSKVFEMVYARRYQFNRRLGEGISVFNPGDRVTKTSVMTNQLLQNQLNSILRDSNRVRYIFSRYAKTNNGIYALMDVKDNNKERFADLHGIISEGVHKVEDIEENVNSLFLALMNPEDKENIPGIQTQSFFDRITYIKIPYILDYNTEVKIYKNIFGDQIEKSFLPRVLQNLAKVIISSRLNTRSKAMEEWISDPGKYSRYCDDNLQLLKMDLFAGYIPTWLTEEDRKRFTAKRRTRIIAESEMEGDRGLSGRDSIKIFNEFYSTYAKKDKLINMAMVYHFFKEHRKDLSELIPEGFLDSLVRSYDYAVLQEVKESLYYYNDDQISRDIKNYLFAVNFEVGTVERCIYTGEDLEITEEFFEGIERRILGSDEEDNARVEFRKDIQKQYASKTLTQDMLLHGKSIEETDVYENLYERYVHNLKAKVMDPFLKNENFRRAIKDYDTDSFKTYDRRIREEVTFLMKNLNEKYGYSEQGAKEICMYVIDNNLAETFSE
ncbi:MAG: serine protein kinase PrkA [Deltaproteobacteria bacterium]|nr:serine protein kinase PrkA [Deltaproteobacteria bacterium]MBW2017011.1 serine protein kinase PrkA [Deltaproteobacteria bacterium]MBW2129445.1 serine protein kinase PrkA [Deltaproteobacteria bacterium]MBW2304663.1 serine protein kinase PrkA [Deltaproteobacteria bacterium]